MSNPRESGHKNDQEWIERAQKVIVVFYLNQAIQDKFTVLKERFRGVYELSPLYHACIDSGMLANNYSLDDNQRAKIKDFEAQLQELIKEAEKTPQE